MNDTGPRTSLKTKSCCAPPASCRRRKIAALDAVLATRCRGGGLRTLRRRANCPRVPRGTFAATAIRDARRRSGNVIAFPAGLEARRGSSRRHRFRIRSQPSRIFHAGHAPRRRIADTQNSAPVRVTADISTRMDALETDTHHRPPAHLAHGRYHRTTRHTDETNPPPHSPPSRCCLLPVAAHRTLTQTAHRLFDKSTPPKSTPTSPRSKPASAC